METWTNYSFLDGSSIDIGSHGISRGQAGMLPMKHGQVRRAVEKVGTEMNRTDGIYFEQRAPWRKFLGGMFGGDICSKLMETDGN
jgi:hypothetical protein